jgi:ubiquinone/menaquinone biosynthesis C-methylase UbiE
MEDTGYYDFMAEMGVPYFHFGGLEAARRRVAICQRDSGKRVLVVGCGTGYSACYIAGQYGCHVDGIDISGAMVSRAVERARESGLQDNVKFRVADAHALPFEDGAFDIVLTEFVSIFLDKSKAFAEYARVLENGGYVGINELFKSEETPDSIRKLIEDAERSFREASELPFALPSPTEWRGWFEEAGFGDVQVERIGKAYSVAEYMKAIGGFGAMMRMTFASLRQVLFNKDMRGRLMKLEKLKRILMRNRKAKPYVGAILCTGHRASAASVSGAPRLDAHAVEVLEPGD